jgi:hypothetical protein
MDNNKKDTKSLNLYKEFSTKYIKLSKKELNKIDDYWIFINYFIHPELHGIDGLTKNFWHSNKGLFDAQEYRNYIREIISKKYTISEFLFFEKILNKLLWNLIQYTTDIKNDIPMSYIQKNNNIHLRLNNSGRSFTRKMIIFNEKENCFYYFPNYYNISNEKNNTYLKLNKILTAMTDRKLYEKCMKNKRYINKIIPYYFYYPLDYPFPNVNLLFYNENSDATWTKNIKDLYFSKNNDKWYKHTNFTIHN